MGLDLGKQVGPLPLGAWLAVGGTGVGIALWARGPGSGTAEDAPPVDPFSSTGTGVTGQWIDVTPPAPVGDAPVTDNDEWGRRAIAWLIAEGHDAALSQSGITKALQERRLSVREYALWWLALRHFGGPPYGVVVGIPGGWHPPGQNPHHHTPGKDDSHHGHKNTVPHAGRWYRVTGPGDSLKRVARRAYNNEAHWHRIFQANREGVKRPDGSRGWMKTQKSPLTPGRRLFIPN